MYEASAGEWRSGPVRLLVAPDDRRIGLRPAPGPVGALLRTRSIHTFGMTAPIAVVAIDADGVIVAGRAMAPRRVAWWLRARWVLEVPLPHGLPRQGERVRLWVTTESG